jgi:hypothetical protein
VQPIAVIGQHHGAAHRHSASITSRALSWTSIRLAIAFGSVAWLKEG